VITHQNDAVIIQRETAHAVKLVRRHQAVIHGLASLRYHAVRKPFRQVQNAIGIFDHRAIAEHFVAGWAVNETIGGGLCAKGIAGQGKGGGGGHKGAT